MSGGGGESARTDAEEEAHASTARVDDARLQQRLERCQRETAGTELDLSGLDLTELPAEALALFPSLRHLNLRNNRLEQLPHDFARAFPQLVQLNAASNALAHLPEQFGALRCLQKLSLADNLLQELPATFSHLHALEELNLAGNALRALDDELGNQLLKLQTLDLSRNAALREIPASFATTKPSQLRVVDLRGDDGLEAVPDKIRRLHERNVIVRSRAKRRELIARALRVRHAVAHTMLNAAIVNPTAAGGGGAANAGAAATTSVKKTAVK